MRTTAIIAFCVVATTAASGTPDASADRRWHAGAYSFSDEFGGFLIRGVSGTGTRDDPFVIQQEMLSASPVTLVIRVATAIRRRGPAEQFATGMMHVRIRALNNSGISWIEYEFELQEQLGQASVFGDGLSFDQRRTAPENRWSDRFRRHETDFEPYDRVVFRDGHVDPLQTVEFALFITDFTPKLEFYLRQDPRIPLG